MVFWKACSYLLLFIPGFPSTLSTISSILLVGKQEIQGKRRHCTICLRSHCRQGELGMELPLSSSSSWNAICGTLFVGFYLYQALLQSLLQKVLCDSKHLAYQFLQQVCNADLYAHPYPDEENNVWIANCCTAFAGGSEKAARGEHCCLSPFWPSHS